MPSSPSRAAGRRAIRAAVDHEVRRARLPCRAARWRVALGLEHGFTVNEQPRRDLKDTKDGAPSLESLLSFSLKIRGTLHPHVSADSQGVKFRDGAGATVLTYAGLKVWDADGKVLASHFESAEGGVRLPVEERRRYPLTIDPIAQQAYLKPADVGTTQAVISSATPWPWERGKRGKQFYHIEITKP